MAPYGALATTRPCPSGVTATEVGAEAGPVAGGITSVAVTAAGPAPFPPVPGSAPLLASGPGPWVTVGPGAVVGGDPVAGRVVVVVLGGA